LIKFPDKSGTLATTSDIPDVTAYASLLDYITVEDDGDETYHSLNDNTMIAGQLAATDLIYSDNALVAPMVWGDNLYGGSVTCDSAEFGTLTSTGKFTCKGNIQTPGYVSTDEAYINTNYISGSLRALNDENAIVMGGDFKVEAYRNATGRLYVANRITSYGSLFVEGDSYLKSTNYTGPIYLHYGN
jgi:hypothetical protein